MRMRPRCWWLSFSLLVAGWVSPRRGYLLCLTHFGLGLNEAEVLGRGWLLGPRHSPSIGPASAAEAAIKTRNIVLLLRWLGRWRDILQTGRSPPPPFNLFLARLLFTRGGRWSLLRRSPAARSRVDPRCPLVRRDVTAVCPRLAPTWASCGGSFAAE